MVITREFLECAKSDRGGWNTKQLNILGYKTFTHGWLRDSVGKELSDNDAAMFVKLRNVHLEHKKEIRKQSKKARREKESWPQEICGLKYEPVESLTYEQQYNHPNWQRKRLEIMHRDGFKCMLCGNMQKTLHVHHNTYDGKYLWLCNNSSMITLCTDCHEKHHNRKFK